MAAELLGAKLLAPFFGSSLYVWSSVMAVTLVGLALGYFIGGFFSTKNGIEKRLYSILVLGALIIALMPFTVQMCFALFSKLSLLPSVIISSTFLLVPPVFLMGMVSPIIISLIDLDFKSPGKSSGIVYAISTLGGIIATFLFGFYIIPNFGLSMPCIVTAITLGLVPSFLLIKGKSLMPILLIGGIWFSLQSAKVSTGNSRIKILAMQEGILGQLLVFDYPSEYYYNDSTRRGQTSRWLFVNRISQTMDDKMARPEKNEERYFTYVYKIASIIDSHFGINDSTYFRKSLGKKNQKKILLLGLGGGSVANYLSNKGYSVEACELDERIYEISKKYFNLNPFVNVTIDDARHFINTSQNKYDVIIFDTFKGEEAPNHVITKQSLAKIKSMLNSNALVFVNSFGYWKGKRGLGMRSIYKTFTSVGFNTKVQPTQASEDQRNLIFISSQNNKLKNITGCLKIGNEVSTASVLDDNKPIFEKMNSLAALSWRRAAIQTFLYDSLQRQLPFFY